MEQNEVLKVEKKSYKRITGKSPDILPLALILAFILLSAGEILIGITYSIVFGLFGVDETRLTGSLGVFLMYFDFIGIWIVLLPVMLIPKTNRPMGKSLLFDKNLNNIKGLLIGTAVGFGMNAACILLSVLLGDIDLSFDTFEIGKLLLIFLAVTVQSGAEEIIDRLYVYQKLRRRYRSPIIAILGNSVFFASLHVFNPGLNIFAILQIVIIGVMLSLIVYYFNSLWMCIMIHTAWNFSQNIIFGCPNSGIVSEYSIFRLEGATNGIFFDTAFGVEGSWGACIMLVLATVVVILIGEKRRKANKLVDIWEEEERRLEAERSAQSVDA